MLFKDDALSSLMESFDHPINEKDVEGIENPPGIIRKTLAYNKDVLLCKFDMKKGAQIPLHSHIHSQIGYVISGKVRFFTEKGEFTVGPGDSYVFNGNEKHGADILEDSRVIEVFSPRRDEYVPR